ncbi:MAG TPA: VOC family protein [bacterium]|nr:VOC family protein [bacterium]
MRVSYAIVFVSDMARSLAFYRDVIGLPIRFESSHWSELGGDGTALALHLSREAGETAEMGEDIQAGRCRPGFEVPDLDAFHVRMTEHGVPCVQEPRDVFGARVAQYADPDGLVLSVGEAQK